MSSREHLVEVLTHGDRVDGSSIFPGVDSDVYIVPRHRTDFVNPFGEREESSVVTGTWAESRTGPQETGRSW